MTSYGVGVSNTFYLLGDEDGAPAPTSPAKQALAPAPAKPAHSNERSNVRRGNDKRAPRDNRRAGAGAAGAGGAPRRAGKREFDRHSGTGRNSETKREGKGRYNWGQQGDNGNGDERRRGGQGGQMRRRPRKDQDAPREDADDNGEKNTGADTENAADVTEADAPGSAKENEEDVDSDADKQDLSEYLKQLEELRVSEDRNLSIRQAVDDEEDDQFKATEAFTREAASDEEDELMLGASLKSRKKAKALKKKKGAMSLDEFTKGQRSRRQGGSRGNGSRQGYGRRGNDSNVGTSSVNIDDKSAFPALVSAQ